MEVFQTRSLGNVLSVLAKKLRLTWDMDKLMCDVDNPYWQLTAYGHETSFCSQRDVELLLTCGCGILPTSQSRIIEEKYNLKLCGSVVQSIWSCLFSWDARLKENKDLLLVLCPTLGTCQVVNGGQGAGNYREGLAGTRQRLEAFTVKDHRREFIMADWRVQIDEASRTSVVNRIKDALQNIQASSRNEPDRTSFHIARRFEEKTFQTATTHEQYVQEIGRKLLIIDIRIRAQQSDVDLLPTCRCGIRTNSTEPGPGGEAGYEEKTASLPGQSEVSYVKELRLVGRTTLIVLTGGVPVALVVRLKLSSCFPVLSKL